MALQKMARDLNCEGKRGIAWMKVDDLEICD